MQRQTERALRARRRPLRRFRSLPRRAHQAHSDRPPAVDARRSPRASSGSRSTRPTTSPPSGSTLRRPGQGLSRWRASTSPPTRIARSASCTTRRNVLRRHMMNMASGLGQGYIGQGLGIADVLAALYFHELRYDPADPHWAGRDRFVLSTGHYSIALWAALAEARHHPDGRARHLWRRREPARHVRRSTRRPASR